jgi:hypothetical protein
MIKRTVHLRQYLHTEGKRAPTADMLTSPRYTTILSSTWPFQLMFTPTNQLGTGLGNPPFVFPMQRGMAVDAAILPIAQAYLLNSLQPHPHKAWCE